MKRKNICCVLALIMLCRPVQIFAVENTTDVTAADTNEKAEAAEEARTEEIQTEKTQIEETQIEETQTDEMQIQETDTVQSLLGELSAGADLIGGGYEVADARNITGSSSGIESNPESGENENAAETEAAPEEQGQASDIREALGDPVGAAAVVEMRSPREVYAKAYEDAQNANWGYTNLGIANVDNNLNIRASAGEDAKLVGKLPRNAACEILASDGTWAHIRSGKVEGYVSCEYLLTGLHAKRRAEELVTTIATVTTDSLKVRAEANTDSEVITMVPNGEQLEVVASEGDWIRVSLDDEEVFVSAQYVKVDAQLETAITLTELLYGQGVSDVRVELCQYAKEFLGNPYVWGGTSLTKGADCSGYVLSIFKKYGVSLPHSSRAQANCGTKISLSEAQPGDLVFYGKGKTIDHVAIYIGSGQVIHASNPKTGIRISNVSYRTPLKVVRLLQS